MREILRIPLPPQPRPTLNNSTRCHSIERSCCLPYQASLAPTNGRNRRTRKNHLDWLGCQTSWIQWLVSIMYTTVRLPFTTVPTTQMTTKRKMRRSGNKHFRTPSLLRKVTISIEPLLWPYSVWDTKRLRNLPPTIRWQRIKWSL